MRAGEEADSTKVRVAVFEEKMVRVYVGDRVQLAEWLPFTTAGKSGEIVKIRRYLLTDEVTIKLDSGMELTVSPCEIEWTGLPA